ncbi:mitochondrial glycoprotein family member [Heterostelium album PN500]|uniref:Mitochondrial glycoprotein family member n=1 Tax=Heterostelium pallidum (strain ATCC 26659 / Pp 5 / PN500) TaxID=670386 RepID=D3BTJ2_HETP5|nr:mitochondrial glycoprotein family member [Heterostelium album PN500]EFA75409.1 mitochondrial glycoprotein family member [Heterostelium album PN500]|eukprot:XP_020427543.1 mitochondrial glycoprotein family member [Heterostelium album PN500]
MSARVIYTFSQKSLIPSQVSGVRRGLLSCCGTNVQAQPTDSHHHGVARRVSGPARNSITNTLYATQPSSTQAIRQYSSGIQNAPTPSTLLRDLCDNEINDFNSLIPENDDNQSFLEESGFTLSKDNEYAYLKKTNENGEEITVRFDLVESMADDPYDYGKEEEDGEEGEEGEEDEEEPENDEEKQDEDIDEEAEEGEEGEEDMGNGAHEHPYEISIKRKVDGKDVHVTFGCFASADGSYTVSGFYYGTFNEPANPVDIAGTSSDFQDNILLFLQQYGVSEGLSFFIHDYVHSKKLKDYIQSFETLKTFIGNK